jgi:sugar phosphate isomerase/epimerase
MADRRSFLKVAGMGMAVASVPLLAEAGSAPAGEKNNGVKMKLGVASYSLRAFSQEEALDMTQRAGLDRITFKSMHLPLDSDKETINQALQLCREKGVTLYGGGVIKMRSNDDVDQAFEYAGNAGMKMIIGDPAYDQLEYIEGKVKKYDIKLAIHNHGPGDHQLYPSGVDAYNRVSHMDKRMGVCLDIGHTKRINRDPVNDLEKCFDRVFDIHIKDVTAASEAGKTIIVGRGVIDIVGFLKKVVELDYRETLAFEYEADEKDPLPGMMESIGYVKGVLATL